MGGISAVFEGAPVSTFDLDVVHSTEAKNVTRLFAALASMDAYYRPDASPLSSSGHQLLMTRYGPLDLLGAIGRSHRFEDLLNDAIEIEAGPGVLARVPRLERLIAVKLETAAGKDLSMLPILRRTLEEKDGG